MSHLARPRLHFHGTFQADVFTANNDDIASVSSSLQFVDSARVQVDTRGMTDQEFQEWLRGGEPGFGVRGGWNLYGTGRCRMHETTVRSAEFPGGGLDEADDSEALIGGSVELRDAVMVDIDPEGTLGTQIFCDRFRIKQRDLQIIGPPTRFYSRWVNPRNLGLGGFSGFGSVWHGVIPPDLLGIVGDSPFLQALRDAQAKGSGLFIRFACYGMRPVLGSDEYTRALAAGLKPKNLAVGSLTGSVGLWQPGEMTSIVSGRRLASRDTATVDHRTVTLNSAVAEVDEGARLITIDLIQAIPELNETMVKLDLGPLRLKVESGWDERIMVDDLGEVSYARDDYVRRGGIAEVPFPPSAVEAVRGGRLLLVQESSGARLLAERELTIETDDRCVYLQEREFGRITLRVQEKGSAPGSEQVIRILQYTTSNRTLTPVPPADPVVSAPSRVTVPPDGMVEIEVTGRSPGTCLLVFSTGGGSDPTGGDPVSNDFFANMRVLPEDDYEAISDDDLTFAFVYQEVLRYYHLLYPAMAEVFPLDDETTVRGLHEPIRERIAKDLWNESGYMPVSRELSDGKRNLLDRFLSRAAGESEP